MKSKRAASNRVVPDEHEPPAQTATGELPVKLFDTKGLGLLLGASPSTVFRWRRDGLISFYRLAGRVVFSPEHVREFLRSHEVPATSQNGNGKAA